MARETPKVNAFSEDQPRDENGQWSGGGVQETASGDVYYHGTTADKVQSIKDHGIDSGKSGPIHAESERGHVYMADSEHEALYWARAAAENKGNRDGDVALIEIHIPKSVAQQIKKDSNPEEDNGTFKFKGKIKKEWIKKIYAGKLGNYLDKKTLSRVAAKKNEETETQYVIVIFDADMTAAAASASRSMKQLVVSAAGYKTRTETFDGRECIVVPVVALVEGVVWPMNAETPELVKAEEYSRAPQGWNGRPIFHGHPIRNGRPVSGNVPEVLETEKIGVVFNATIRKGKLAMEAWLDIERTKEVAPELLQRVEDGDDIEISVGAFVDTDDSEGTYDGKKYRGAWQDIVPDHLALLPEGVEGACSVEAGCGVRAAQTQEAVVAEVKKTRKPSVLGKFLQMFRAAQPAAEMSDSDLRRKLYEEVREVVGNSLMNIEAFYPVTNPDRVVYTCYVQSLMPGDYGDYVMYERQFSLDANGNVTLNEAAVEVEPVLSYEPVLMAEVEPVVAKGARNSKSDLAKIQAMHDHSVALGANCDPKAMSAAKPKTASGACACGGPGKAPEPTTAKETDMKKDELVKFLETATEDQIKALSVAAGEKPAEQPAAVAAPAAAAVVAPVVPAAEIEDPAKPVTIEDLMAKASPEVKAQFDSNVKAAADKQAATIKALKDTGRCTISDEVLKAKTQVELDQLLALAGKPAVTAAVDFGGQGAPRAAADGESKGVPEVPSLVDAIRAAEAKK